MATLEQEILEKFGQLDADAQERVKEMIVHWGVTLPGKSNQPFDFRQWYADLQKVHEQIRQNHGGVFPKIDTVALLREVREEE